MGLMRLGLIHLYYPSFSDIDILCHWLSPDTPVHVSSFGGLQHFRKPNKPAEAGDATRCLDCSYEAQCPYSAKKGRSLSRSTAPPKHLVFVSLSGQSCRGTRRLACVPSRGWDPRYRECHERNTEWTLWQVRIRM